MKKLLIGAAVLMAFLAFAMLISFWVGWILIGVAVSIVAWLIGAPVVLTITDSAGRKEVRKYRRFKRIS